jgi:hypothetical protein
MIGSLLFPALLGALASLVLCGIRGPRKPRPSLALALAIAFVVGVGFMLDILGSSFFTSEFWFHNDVGNPVLLALTLFGLCAIASFIPSVVVIVFYRMRWRHQTVPLPVKVEGSSVK